MSDAPAEDLLSQLEDAAGRAADRVGTATVAIGRSPRGSGLVIGADCVLTNAHNLRDRTTQVTFEERSEQASALAVDASSDLAVLEVATEGIEPLTWAPAAPGVGAAVFALARSSRGTRLTPAERFSGLLVRLAGRAIEVGDDFDAMNAALRDRVEAGATLGR